jgi:hypothetical protein
MKEQDYSSRITDEWLIGDVLHEYPSTSIISLQHAPASRTQSGRPFLGPSPDESTRIC